MPETVLSVATTTDSLAVATAAARNDEAGARIPAPPPEVSEMDGSSVVSFEHPRSERTLLLERLAEAENDFTEMSSEIVACSDLPADKATLDESEQEEP